MQRWDAPDSVFAPLVGALPSETEWAGFGNALFAARGAIPVVTITRKVKHPGRFRSVEEVRSRVALTLSDDEAAPFATAIRLLDRSRTFAGPDAAGRTVWDVSLLRPRVELCAPAVPSDFVVAMLHVTSFRVGQSGVVGAPQLALVRHLWANAVLAASSHAIVFGGQRDWRDDWWYEDRQGEG